MHAAGFDHPDDLHYAIDDQVWARLEPDGCATVGITVLGVHLAGEVYMCRPKAVGSLLEAGRSLGVVELAKAIVSVKTPLSGQVIAVNAQLATRPELVHQQPYAAGWLVRLQLSAWAAERARLLHGAEQVVPALEQHAWLHRLGEGR